jgi:hypothetical protein
MDPCPRVCRRGKDPQALLLECRAAPMNLVTGRSSQLPAGLRCQPGCRSYSTPRYKTESSRGCPGLRLQQPDDAVGAA